jgi:hypothetical protein
MKSTWDNYLNSRERRASEGTPLPGQVLKQNVPEMFQLQVPNPGTRWHAENRKSPVPKLFLILITWCFGLYASMQRFESARHLHLTYLYILLNRRRIFLSRIVLKETVVVSKFKINVSL